MTAAGSLAGATALVTGASGGIGAAAARALVHAGARVALHAHRGVDRAERIADELRTLGATVVVLRADLSDTEATAALVADAAAFGGDRLDVLVNNAGIFPLEDVGDVTPASWDAVMDLNVRAPFFCAQAAVPYMRAAGGGRILNVGSAAVDLAPARQPHYIASKAAVVGLTRALARELGPVGIAVNCLNPSLVETATATATFPDAWDAIVGAQARSARQQPADLESAIRFLCSKDAAWITGQTVRVDGGLVMR